MTMNKLEAERDFNRLCMNNFGKVIVLVFHAEWHEHSTEYLENMKNLLELSQPDSKQVIFAELDAEIVPQVASRYNINNVPSVVFTDTLKGELKKFENEVPALIFEELDTFLEEYQKEFEKKRVVMYEKIEKLVKSADVLIFIKGTATEPECKFTRQFLAVMKDLECKFTYYDIIADLDMRHWLRHYNKWPTYPQLYIGGELIGGLDKTKQLIEEGVVQKKIPQSAKIFDPEQRLKKITSENKVILFTVGLATDSELDSEHKSTITLLKDTGIKFNCFNIQSDNVLQEYQQKQYGNNFPLLFVEGNYLGPLAKLQEFAKADTLLEKFPGSEWQLNGEQKLRYLLKQCPVIAFINGIPKETHTEGSKKLVDILKQLNVVYEFYNVDADEQLLADLTSISKYDKTPQLYIKGQLIGGDEAVEKLFKDGDLQELVKDFVKAN